METKVIFDTEADANVEAERRNQLPMRRKVTWVSVQDRSSGPFGGWYLRQLPRVRSEHKTNGG